MPKRTNGRIQRINEEIRKELSDIIRYKVKDSALSGMVSVVKVDTAADIKQAKVYVSVFGSEKEKKDSILALQRAQGFIKRELGSKLRTHHIPTLTFIEDTSIEYSFKISEMLDKMK